MARWEPNASGRLREAAMELFVERGYEQTTVPEIAERAGLTARTFFRYFADKREVLFGRGDELDNAMREVVAAAPSPTAPMQLVAAAFDAVTELVGSDRRHSRVRQGVIDATPELQERELIKMARLGTALREALRQRGVGEPEAGLAAEMGVAAFRVAWDRWLSEPDERSLTEVMRESLERLVTLVGR